MFPSVVLLFYPLNSAYNILFYFLIAVFIKWFPKLSFTLGSPKASEKIRILWGVKSMFAIPAYWRVSRAPASWNRIIISCLQLNYLSWVCESDCRGLCSILTIILSLVSCRPSGKAIDSHLVRAWVYSQAFLRLSHCLRRSEHCSRNNSSPSSIYIRVPPLGYSC